MRRQTAATRRSAAPARLAERSGSSRSSSRQFVMVQGGARPVVVRLQANGPTRSVSRTSNRNHGDNAARPKGDRPAGGYEVSVMEGVAVRGRGVAQDGEAQGAADSRSDVSQPWCSPSTQHHPGTGRHAQYLPSCALPCRDDLATRLVAIDQPHPGGVRPRPQVHARGAERLRRVELVQGPQGRADLAARTRSNDAWASRADA